MGVIERYLMREIARQAILISGLLVVMFASYSAQRYLTEAANGTLALPVVLAVIFYKIVISLEMLLPVGLYVAAAVVLGRLHTDSEITAFFCLWWQSVAGVYSGTVSGGGAGVAGFGVVAVWQTPRV